MDKQQIIDWLLMGDVSLQYQAYRTLLGIEREDLQQRIATEGWGKAFLSRQNTNGHWGLSFYQPKWISTHYTLLDLRTLGLGRANIAARKAIDITLDKNKAGDGGISLGPSTLKRSDVCVNGMFLNYASYFRTPEERLRPVVDNILNDRMLDGGFNCQKNRIGARHSSLHSTISVLEGLLEFQKAGYTYRMEDIKKALKSGEEFMLIHQLFLSDNSGDIIKKDFLKMTFPYRWKYNILRALDYFREAGCSYDERMEKAFRVILKKRNKDGTWNQQAAHPGDVHFTMEKAGNPSRWITLKALRILKQFDQK